ncbi:MAG: hypothetical protein J4F40_07040 [Alphaproteobacteria bacterium]|nr:hypothetical protein [Alphaproteobacteria bacterium]MCY4496333.1 hypothetical protein [Rhodospirillaceae bacterium]
MSSGADTTAGANASIRPHPLIETAKASGLEPYAFFFVLLRAFGFDAFRISGARIDQIRKLDLVGQTVSEKP